MCWGFELTFPKTISYNHAICRMHYIVSYFLLSTFYLHSLTACRSIIYPNKFGQTLCLLLADEISPLLAFCLLILLLSVFFIVNWVGRENSQSDRNPNFVLYKPYFLCIQFWQCLTFVPDIHRALSQDLQLSLL